MIPRAALPLLFACAALGCVSTYQDHPEGQRMDISRAIVDNYRATYARGSARYNTNRVAELEADIAQQQALLNLFIEERRGMKIEVGQLRHFDRRPEDVRTVLAMNLEGEIRSLSGEIENRRQVIASLQDRASWHRRQAASETRNIALILRNPAPGEGRDEDTWQGWTVETR